MKRKRRTKKRASEPAKPPSLKAQQQKARKLQQLADDLERSENFNVTRLVVIKSLCQDVKTAARFTLHRILAKSNHATLVRCRER